MLIIIIQLLTLGISVSLERKSKGLREGLKHKIPAYNHCYVYLFHKKKFHRMTTFFLQNDPEWKQIDAIFWNCSASEKVYTKLIIFSARLMTQNMIYWVIQRKKTHLTILPWQLGI
jgi:hypothetical protein